MPKLTTGKIWQKIERAEAEIAYWDPAKRSRLEVLQKKLEEEGRHSSHARYLAYKRLKKEP